jgi:hypothetical protein
MTEQPRTSGDRTGGGPSRKVSPWYVLAPAAALVLGLVLGGLLVGVAGDDGEVLEPEPTPSVPAEAEPSSPGTAVVVPDACLAAADTVREAVETIEDGVGAIRDFRAERVIELLDDLEDLDRRARVQAATCTDTTVTDAPLPTEESATP